MIPEALNVCSEQKRQVETKMAENVGKKLMLFASVPEKFSNYSRSYTAEGKPEVVAVESYIQI